MFNFVPLADRANIDAEPSVDCTSEAYMRVKEQQASVLLTEACISIFSQASMRIP